MATTPDFSGYSTPDERIPETKNPSSAPCSAILTAIRSGGASLAAVFGGQGASNATCVEQVAQLYTESGPLVEPLVEATDNLLQNLSGGTPRTKLFFLGREMNIKKWLADPKSRPDTSFISSAPVSFPIIGLHDLMQYCIAGKSLGITPAQFRHVLSGTTGHSQGIVVAAAIARLDCNDWDDFVRVAKWAIEILFWTGWESHSTAINIALPPSAASDSIERGHGTPSHMLSVRGIKLSQLEEIVAGFNQSSGSKENSVYIALVNGLGSFTLAGTPRSLRSLTLRLAQVSAAEGADQSRIPFSERKPVINCSFLPITAPFHTPHLAIAAEKIKARLSERNVAPITVGHLDLPVFHTKSGADIRNSFAASTTLSDILVDAVTTLQVDWAKALQTDISSGKVAKITAHGLRQRISHMMVLGSGRLSTLCHQNVDGFGIRVIDCTVPEPITSDNKKAMGCRSELLAPILSQWQLQPLAWQDKYTARSQPHFRSASEFPSLTTVEEATRYNIETRLNRLLNAPPVMVAGMTPTTVHPDFCAAIMKAGYHVEIAGGGYFNGITMEAAIESLAKNTPAGRGITVNLVYASPTSMTWQISLLQSMIQRGLPIEGLAIGAGVPSPDVAAGYIRDLGAGMDSEVRAGGLRHISFKPGTATAILEVIAIAKAHPTMPVIIQWTGGRGGGHHSTEDFHEPLLETYSQIRECDNIYLVVGSGFGSGSAMLPYFSGEWSLRFGRPPMPVDGILMGSRMMVALEAHTSSQSKELLLEARGTNEADWERTYDLASAESGCNVLTVVSEFGQPIHKLATRGVILWKELDETIFRLPKPQRKTALLERKDEIIHRLNADSHRPWFAQNSAGVPMDLEDMTYTQVLSRLYQLLYIRSKRRWLDLSHQQLFFEFALRVLERLSEKHATPQSENAVSTSRLDFAADSPLKIMVKINSVCPDAANQLLHPEDSKYFVQRCRVRGRKPVNFILDLDDDFEHWFKKDSLWQSEDVEAVADQDAGRVCILQSPVSVKYSTRGDQPAGEILDEIHHELGSSLRRMIITHKNQSSSVRSTASSGSSWVEDDMPSLRVIPGIQTKRTRSHLVFRPLLDGVERKSWFELLSSHVAGPALSTLLRETTVFRSVSDTTAPIQPNVIREIFAPRVQCSVYIHVSEGEMVLIQEGGSDGRCRVLVRVSCACSPGEGVTGLASANIRIQLYHYYGRFDPEQKWYKAEDISQLFLDWKYDAKSGRLFDKMSDRDQRVQKFFAHLWLPRTIETDMSPNLLLESILESQHSTGITIAPEIYETLHTAVSQAFEGASSTLSLRPGSPIPIEAAVVAGWNALVMPLVSPDIQGNLLRLVHRSITVRIQPGQDPLRIGDSISCQTTVRAVTIEPSGKSIKVQLDIIRSGQKAAVIDTEFFIRGSFNDWQNTFATIDESYELTVSSKVDEAVLRDQSWLCLQPDMTDSLEGMTLTFDVNQQVRPKDKTTYSKIRTIGNVQQKRWNGTLRTIGSILCDIDDECSQDPVTDFLIRKGKAIDGKIALKNPGWEGTAEQIVTMPTQEQSRFYAAVSGDLNPIHTSTVFAALAEIPGNDTIVHGMYTVAVCRQVVENLCGLYDADQRARVRSFSASLVGMVRPGDKLSIVVYHEAMNEGRMVLNVVARLLETGEEVLKAEAEVEQPLTAYVFTGQGSQSQGMGMALYENSPVAQAVWDQMDEYLMSQFGWSILEIIKNNPKELTVYFGGQKGQQVLQNYREMTTEVLVHNFKGSPERQTMPLIPDITPESESYTFRDSRGLVHATQFAQPAIMILEKAIIEHLKAGGLLQENARYAGHSLGEWGAISSMADFIEFSDMMTIAFYRGLLMHFAVPRDTNFRTGYSMVAVNPKRAGHGFDDTGLRAVTSHIAQASGLLMEIVNFNVDAEQYVCAAHVRNIHVLGTLLNALSRRPTGSSEVADFLSAPTFKLKAQTRLGQQIASFVGTSQALPLDVALERGKATVPLTGIDIPFHSQMLRSGIPAFRKLLEKRIKVEDFQPERMVGKWVPNVLGRELKLDHNYLSMAAQVTGSEVLANLAQSLAVD